MAASASLSSPTPGDDTNQACIPSEHALWYWMGFLDAQLPGVDALAQAARALLDEHARGGAITRNSIRSLLADFQ